MNGIIVVDKPGGMTSHDIVLFIRRRFAIKKVGHAGTLDPMATGALILLLGNATKSSGTLIEDDKEYEGVLRLGIRTDTHDSEGRVISSKAASHITEAEIREVFNSFMGEIEQVPPMVSAVRHKGEKLYELARRGIEVERRPRRVTIHDIKIRDINLPDIRFSVRCSKGTYIRKLADDIGENLGCGAHLIELRRIRSGTFALDNAVTFDELRKLDRKGLERYLKSVA